MALDVSRPLISVVIPAKDREATVARALDSLAAQTYGGWEAIVIDDGSTDGTAAVVEQHGREDPRVQIKRQPNGGVSAARNAGIALARRPWLFFLDADDWIVPTSFEKLLAAALDDEVDVSAVYGGYVRVDQDGREVAQRRPPHAEDLFPLFATTCGFAVHACLIRTELVRSVGGFDDSLVTCEDWDLWQKVARAGARFRAIPDYIAYYRMRPTSASANGARMLEDGLRVIDRGHARDPRLGVDGLVHREGAPQDGRHAVRAYFACYAAGLVIAADGNPHWMLDSLGPARPVELDPEGVADTLFHAVANGRASAPGRWPTFPPELLEGCRRFADALGTWAQDRWLSFQVRRALERMVVAMAEGQRPSTVGSWHLLDVECDDDPPPACEVDRSVRQVLCAVRVGGREIGSVELPVVDGWLPPRVLADGIAAELAWDLLRAWMQRVVYPNLEWEWDRTTVRVYRDGCLLLEGEAPVGRDAADWLHDRLGWTVLLQELWQRPGWPSDRFYSEHPEPGTAPRVDASDAPLAVELTAPLPRVTCPGPSVAIGITLAGVPLTTMRLPARRGQVEPHELRRAALTRLGFELCRAVMRELILAPRPASGAALRDILKASAAQRACAETTRSHAGAAVPPLVEGWQGALEGLLPATGGGTVIGQRAAGVDGTGVSRYALLPVAARPEVLAGARSAGDPVLEVNGAAAPRSLVYAPGVQWDRSRLRAPEAEDQELLTRLQFEQTFAARRDPWSYGSDYEQRKYQQTLALVPEGVGNALELGCAEGYFTESLAPLVGSLVACDVSTVALSRAARRCSDCPNVSFQWLDLFTDELPADQELVVCSEVLYYAASRAQLDQAVHAIARALAPGGVLLMANANVLVDNRSAPGFDWDVPFGAGGIARAVRATHRLELVHETRTNPYRIQAYRRRTRRRGFGRGRWRDGVETVEADAGEMTIEAGLRFSENGQPTRVEEPEPDGNVDQRLPVLMYHRVATHGAERTQRWRLHPEMFERQLSFLRDAGYYSVKFDHWRAASGLRRPLPGKPIILTFDDGYADFPEHVPHLLRRYGFSATVFIVSELVGESNVWDAALGEPLSLMDWTAIEGLAAEGIDFGSHSARHEPLVALEPGQLAADLARSRRQLEERLGHPVTSLSYPYGLHDGMVRSIAGGCGYEYGVTTDGWATSWSDQLLSLPRLEVHGTHSLDDFVAMVGT